MRVLCCCTSPHAATVSALRAFAPAAEFADVTGDESGYWREISCRWDGTTSLVIIEQDIEITADVLPSFAACPQPWCTYGYQIFRDPPELLTWGLGCARFTGEAQRAADLSRISESQRRWPYLDCAISVMLHDAGIVPHVHGEVTHHHEYEPVELPPIGKRRAAIAER